MRNCFLKIILVVCGLVLFSCKKETETPEPTPDPIPITPPDTNKGVLKLEFENMVDNLPVDFTTKYLSPSGDTFMISKFNYYISNVILTKSDNSTFAVPNSYYLVQVSQAGSNLINISNVPVGTYKSIQFMLGVDSLRNVSGAQAGDLDPSKNMFWSWTTGYIMLKLEGTAPTSTVSGKVIEYHLGGFKGINKTQRNFNLNFGANTASVTKNTSPKIIFKVNANELFKTPVFINFATLPIVTLAGANAKLIADNYADMIQFKQISN